MLSRVKILLLTILCALVIPCGSQTNTDSLWRAWNDPGIADTLRFQAMSTVIKLNYLHSSPDSAFILTKQQYDFAMKKNMKKHAAQALHMLGRVRGMKGDYTQALSYYTASLKIRKEINDIQGITSCMNNIAIIYKDQGMGAKAIEYFFQCLKIREETGDKKGQASSLGNIGDVYMREKDFTKSLEYYTRSLVLSEEINNKHGVGVSLTSIGVVYKEKGDTARANRYFEQAIATLQPIGDKENLARTYYNMAALREEEKKYEEAIKFQRLSLDLRTQLGDSIGMMRCLYGIGTIYNSMHESDKALAYGEQALKIARKQNVPRVSSNIGELLFNLYRQNGNYKKALEMHQFYIAARDSMKNDELKNAIYKEQLKYDYEKKELLSKAANEAKLKQLQYIAERNDMRKNTWLIISIAFSLLLLSGGLFLFNSFKQKNIISVQKANLLKQKLLVSQINPHFIFNSLNAVQNFVFKQDALKTGDYLAQFAGLMRMILDFSRKDYISVEAECDFLAKYLELQQLRFDNKFSYRLIIDEQIDKEKTFIPPMLAQPFLENAIEHGIFYKKEKGTIELRMVEEEGRLFYEIEDDGVGLKAAEIRKKSSGHSYDSLATLITKERLYTHSQKSRKSSGDIEITDKPLTNPGVKVRFEIPFLQYEPAHA
jgi:tetratricopeptide (TPR) repeat protein